MAETMHEILQSAAKTENTPELQLYWEKRFRDLVEKGFFKISEKTISLLNNQAAVGKPATPFGDIVLSKHLDQNNSLDELSLQATVETSVRLLDSLLEIINFTEEAKNIVTQYRKIGLGLADFKEYIDLRNTTSELDEIDYIGSLISSSSYRASETLAEEKGVCMNWNKIEHHLRPKSFEYWYDVETGEVRSGLEMSEDYDLETVVNSRFVIVPRRNSNILLFPTDLEWQIWSDRDESAPKTEISKQGSEIQSIFNGVLDEKLMESKPTDSVNFAGSESKIEQIKEEKDDENPFATLSTNNSEEAENIYGDADDQLDSQVDLDELEDELEDEPETEASNDEFENLQNSVFETEEVEETEGDDTEMDLADTDANLATDQKENATNNFIPNQTEIKNMTESQNTEPLFQIGELVQVKNPDKAEFSKVYQVIDIIFNDQDKTTHYKLTGSAYEVDENVWQEEDLSPVELTDILDKINTPQTQEPIIEIKETVVQHVHSVIFNQNNEILVEQTEQGYTLPGGLLPKNTRPEDAIEELLFEKYGVSGKTTYEIGTAITNSFDEDPSLLHLGYVVEAKVEEMSELSWVKEDDLIKSGNYSSVLLSKLHSQKLYFNSTSDNIEKDQAEPIIAINNQINYNLKNNMSKYLLKLEQVVKTSGFGKIRASLQYNSKGIKLMVVDTETITPELSSVLNTMLNLINFTLEKQMRPEDVAKQIETQAKSGESMPINELMEVLSEVLKDAPATIEEINSSIIIDNFSEEMSKAIESVSKAKTTGNSSSNNSKGFFGQFGS